MKITLGQLSSRIPLKANEGRYPPAGPASDNQRLLITMMEVEKTMAWIALYAIHVREHVYLVQNEGVPLDTALIIHHLNSVETMIEVLAPQEFWEEIQEVFKAQRVASRKILLGENT